jgi:hypothetical protein
MALHVFVIKETELEDPQDLRARSRKFLNLTNERKNMSTKTNFKRVALVAVASLGLGVLTSVAPANAVSDNGVSVFSIGSAASNTGSAASSFTKASNLQTGFVTVTSALPAAAGGVYSLTTGYAATGIVLAGAQLPFLVSTTSSATSGNALSVVVTGGTLSSVAMDSVVDDGGVITDQHVLSVNGSRTTATVVQNGTTRAALAGIFTVSAAAGSTATIAAYEGTGIDDTSTATAGTLLGIWTLTVATASASGAYNAANSSVYTQPAIALGGTSSTVQAYDSTSRLNNGQVGIIWVNTKDAYLGTVTGALAVTATNSSTVVASNNSVGASDSYSGTTSFSTVASFDGDGYVVVKQPTSGVAGSTTVTITLDGEVIGTKTINWNGDVASIAVVKASSASIFKNGAADSVAGTDAQAIVYVAKDAAGNAVSLTAAPTISSATGALVGATLSTTAGTTYALLQTASLGYGYGTLLVPSSSLHGAGSYKLKVLNSAGTAIYSDAQNVTVSQSSLDSFSASWDKTTYAPGEIAVLTVTGKDSKGNLIADGYAASGLSLTVAGSATAGFTSVGTACSASSTFSGGSFTCKFAANTEGAWSYSVDLTTATAQSPSVGALKITAGGATSNADVLKAIVSLIASINKQIAALQKALLRR